MPIKSRCALIIFSFVLSVILALVASPRPTSATVTIVPVDAVPGEGGASPSLKLNSSGLPIIAYLSTLRTLQIAICNNVSCNNPTITIVDSAGEVGAHPSLALNSMGNPVISYLDLTNSKLKVVVCGNVACTSGNTIVTLDNAEPYVGNTSLSLNSSGNPVITYTRENSIPGQSVTRDLRIAVCGNNTCTQNNVISTLSSDFTEQVSSLALNSSGNPVIAFYEESLNLIVCGNATCTFGNTRTTVDNGSGDTGRSPSLILNSNGNPVISYVDMNDGNRLKLAVCGNATCTNGNVLTPLTSNTIARSPSMILDSSGNPVVGFLDLNTDSLNLVRCGNISCTTGNTFTPITNSSSSSPNNPTLALDSAGNPIVGYYSSSDRSLDVVFCSDAACNASTTRLINRFTMIGKYTSIALNSAGNPVISYQEDIFDGDLKLAYAAPSIAQAFHALSSTPMGIQVIPPRSSSIAMVTRSLATTIIRTRI